jgi:hypothetical protein
VGFFNGSSQRNQNNNSSNCVLYLLESHLIKMKATLGIGSYNFIELMALILLLNIAKEKRVRLI